MAEKINRRKFFINLLYGTSAFFGISSISDSCNSQAVGEKIAGQDKEPGEFDNTMMEGGDTTIRAHLEKLYATKSSLTFDAFSKLGLSIVFVLWARALENPQTHK